MVWCRVEYIDIKPKVGINEIGGKHESVNMTEESDNFYSLDDILATQERIHCKVELPIYKLGKNTKN